MILENGKYYRNGHGDVIGPIEERVPGVFLDNYGAVYRPNGYQWGHVPESLGNIVAEIINESNGQTSQNKD